MGRRVVLIVSAVLLASVTSFLSAGGQREDPIRRARELVAENRIDEAILVLESVVREDPERIREAEALMSTIREIRGEYNVLFEQLIDNLVNNPDDIERTLAIIDQMEATGLIGPHKGSKPREVYIQDVFALEQFLQNLKEKGLL